MKASIKIVKQDVSSLQKKPEGFQMKPGGFLKKPNGFGLWQALMIILIISGLMIVVLQYARIASQHTADTYIREQTELYLNSAIEMSMLAISLHDRSTGCLSSYAPPVVTKNGITYAADVNITRYYLLSGSADAALCGTLSYPVQTEQSHGMTLMEIEASATMGAKTLSRILRRTLQRP